MKRLIDESMKNRQKRRINESAISMYDEVLQHLQACRHHCLVFHGQEKTLNAVASYIRNESDLPMVIHGKSGCGKTSILAKAFSVANNDSPVTIIRFLGTTPSSSLIISLLKNVSQQIGVIYGYQSTKEIPTKFSLLVQHFNEMLELATESKPLVLFLDSVDQLSASYETKLLQWIPAKLPAHVKLILSTLPVCEEDNLLEILEKKLSTSANFVAVDTLDREEGASIVRAWLKGAGRRVTFEQQLEIDRVLSVCSLPLFLRLLFDKICRWRSFELDLLCFVELSSTIYDSINALFERLEVSYGKMFVAATFAYITVSKDGLSETELEDVLSLDDDVLNSVYQYHRSPVRRIPPLVWTRLRSEIPNYLTEREADGVTVIKWYHRQFDEVAKDRYLRNVNTVKAYHSLLADYFLGVWSGRPKPFRYTDVQRKVFSLSSDELENSADRLVPKQQLVFLDDGKISSYNLRKLGQLSHHLVKAERLEEMENHLLLNFNWLYAKLVAMPLQALFGDFVDALSASHDLEIKAILDSLRLAGSSLTRYPDMLGIHIIGRLLPYYRTHVKIKRLIDSCDRDGIQRNALVPANHCMHTPGGPLLYSLVGHPGVPFGIQVTSDKQYLVSVSRICMIWDIEIGDLWRSVEPPIHGFMRGLVLSKDDKCAVCYTNPDNEIVIIFIATGEFNKFSNPIRNGDNICGLRFDGTHILTWSAARWTVIDMNGDIGAEGDFLHGDFTILEMFMTSQGTKPIAKIEVPNRHNAPPSSSRFIRATGFDFNDFLFSGCVAIAEDFSSLYACSVDDGKIQSTKIQSTAIVHHVRTGQAWIAHRELGDTPHTVHALTLSGDETWLVASVDPGFVLWKTTENGVKAERINLNLTKGKKNYSGSRNMCVFSRDNQYMMAGSGTMIFVYNLTYRRLVKEISAHFDRIQDIIGVVTPQMNIAISSSSDRTIKIWNFNNITKPVPTPIQHDKEIDSIAISGRSNLAISVLRDSVGVWNISDGSLDRTLDVSKCETVNTPTGFIVKMNCAIILNSGKYIIGADTQKLIFWETDTGRVVHLHYFTLEEDEKSRKYSRQLLLTDDDSRVFVILRTKSNFIKPDTARKGLCVCIKVDTMKVAYEIEFICNDDCPSVLTSNNLYIVIPIRGERSKSTQLGVWHVNVGIFLYEIGLDKLHPFPIIDLVQQRHQNSQIAVVDRDKASLVEVNRKLWKKSTTPCVDSFLRWNGHCTSDGKFGVRRSVRGKSLELFSLLTSTAVRTLYFGQHPGDIEGSITITKNDKHAIYHQSRNNIVRVFRIGGEVESNPELATEIAAWPLEARVCGMDNSSDGTRLVVGLTDGRLLVYVIADGLLEENMKKLDECRRLLGDKASPNSLNGNNNKGVSPTSRKWSKAITIARITAKAHVATRSESKICCVQ
ncbi:hypothetical protein LSH36_145g04079 [Paralvinella palmiformis]|uniref:NACHT domain-containing protein n=1 Tax=Paralvinella palmiformis TaxID=53620 RepID=A0AAD9JUU4_9ANNE|nr:hypothetical protein LSH36_145g04079 [Paralvinella palmiformis]